MPIKIYDYFDAEIPVGDVPMPFKVKRFKDRAEYEAFAIQWDALIVPRRGTVEQTEDEAAALDVAVRAFVEESIGAYITLAPGVVQVNDEDVLTGAGLFAVFYMHWREVLFPLMFEILAKNKLSDIVKKTSSSPLASGTGSAASSTDAGSAPAPTAALAGSSSSAPIEAVTA